MGFDLSMEVLRVKTLAWKDSGSLFLLNEDACGHKQNVHSLELVRVKSVSGLTRSFAQCKSAPHWEAQIRHPSVCRRRSSSVHAIAGKSSDLMTSEDDHLHTRVKLLQNAFGPNKTLLDAQAKVCTGPTQTRPLDEVQAYKVLITILQSGTLSHTNYVISPFPPLNRFKEERSQYC